MYQQELVHVSTFLSFGSNCLAIHLLTKPYAFTSNISSINRRVRHRIVQQWGAFNNNSIKIEHDLQQSLYSDPQ